MQNDYQRNRIKSNVSFPYLMVFKVTEEKTEGEGGGGGENLLST